MSDENYLEDFDDTSTFENKAGLAEVRRLESSPSPVMTDEVMIVRT